MTGPGGDPVAGDRLEHAWRHETRDAFVTRYLSPAHRDSPGDGCPTAGFGVDLAHTGARQGRFFAGLEFVERLDRVLIGEDDLVVHRSRWRGRHVGPLFGVPATGRVVTVDHVEMWRVAGDTRPPINQYTHRAMLGGGSTS